MAASRSRAGSSGTATIAALPSSFTGFGGAVSASKKGESFSTPHATALLLISLEPPLPCARPGAERSAVDGGPVRGQRGARETKRRERGRAGRQLTQGEEREHAP